jgi:hypothetical protein
MLGVLLKPPAGSPPESTSSVRPGDLYDAAIPRAFGQSRTFMGEIAGPSVSPIFGPRGREERIWALEKRREIWSGAWSRWERCEPIGS